MKNSANTSIVPGSVLSTLPLLALLILKKKKTKHFEVDFVIVQSLSHVRLFCDSMECSMPGFPVFTISLSLLKLSVRWVSDAISS